MDAAPNATCADDSLPKPNSYTQILKSTALIGGSSFINIAFAIVRNKAIASMLGPSGLGVMALYNAVIDLSQTIAGLGIQAGGVRQIAEAAGAGDADRAARIATVVRRTSLALALAGAAGLAAASSQVAAFTFGDHLHGASVALLSLALLCQVVFAGQLALIQGMRRISDLARVNILSAFFATAICVPAVYIFGEAGIAPALVASAGAALATSWWYGRSQWSRAPAITRRQFGDEAAALLRLGVVFMASALLTVGAGYAVRLLVLRNAGIDAAGLYQAAWALGGLYTGFILQTMGTDFFPRLTAVSADDLACNRLVNEQAQISMLLAGPGVIATLTAAPFVISLFYTAEFLPAVIVLRAICLGMMLRVVSWPMGFIVLAKGARAAFFWTEVAATVAHVGLAWLLLPRFGVAGAGFAYFGLYVWHSMLIYCVVRRMSGFRWSRANIELGLLFLPAAVLAFAASLLLPVWQATAVGGALTVMTGLFSLYSLKKLTPSWAALLARRAKPPHTGADAES